VCVAAQQILPRDATVEDAKAVVRQLYQTRGATVVYLFTTSHHTQLILLATQQLGLEGQLQVNCLIIAQHVVVRYCNRAGFTMCSLCVDLL
jgi:hypothetical protein